MKKVFAIFFSGKCFTPVLSIFRTISYLKTGILVLIGYMCMLPWVVTSAQPLLPEERRSKEQLAELYQVSLENQRLSINQRLNKYSQLFLGKPYILYALGEGPEADFDQNPRFRFDGFDCETYVTTVIALSLSKNTQQFISLMNKIRYRNGTISFLNRHHFTDSDWNKYNQNAGIIKDITENIHDAHHKSVAKLAQTQINKSNWVYYTADKRIFLPNASSEEKTNKTQTLIKNARNIPIQNSSIPYIPLSRLFNEQQKPIWYLWKQIPDGAIIEIIRPNWPLKSKIGTNLNVSHLGFAFWRNNVLWFRHASNTENKVVELPMADYLRNALDSPTIKGINIQVVIDRS